MDCLFLVRHGVPFDVAFALPRRERLAWVVVIGHQVTGDAFDWSTETWIPRQ